MNNRRYLSRWLLAAISVASLALILLANPIQPHAQVDVTRTPAVQPTQKPTLSADARNLTGNIVYVSNRSGSYELYVTSPDGSDTRALSYVDDPAVINWSPSISPNGTQIAYVANSRENEQVYDIYVMGIDGSNPQRINDLKMKIYCIEWSPDATKFVLCAEHLGESDLLDIYTINVDGTELLNLTNNPAYDSNPSWSPDGKFIAFHSDRAKTNDALSHVYVMKADGSDVRQLTPGHSASWSPDGKKIAYVGLCDKRWLKLGTMCVMNADGSDPQYVPSSLGVDIAPHWSPNGKFLVVTNRPAKANDEKFEIYVIAVDTTERIRLTENNFVDNLPTWGITP